MSYRFHCIILLVLLLVFSGCGEHPRLPPPPAGMPALTPCTIQVTFGGERLEGVGVLLQPKNPEGRGWPAGGRTDSEGRAEMMTAVYYSGVVPGEYFVILQKFAPGGCCCGCSQSESALLPIETLIPIKYSRAESTITIVVTTEKAEYVFELEGLTPDDLTPDDLTADDLAPDKLPLDESTTE